MIVEIPGYDTLELKNIAIDFNGTLALDGKIAESTAQRIIELSKSFRIVILTADTNGNAKEEVKNLPVEIITFPNNAALVEKLKIVQEMIALNTVAIGNGRNDMRMCQVSSLSIGIMGKEGLYSSLINMCDIISPSIDDALDLLLKPNRLIATLRG